MGGTVKAVFPDAMFDGVFVRNTIGGRFRRDVPVKMRFEEAHERRCREEFLENRNRRDVDVVLNPTAERSPIAYFDFRLVSVMPTAAG
jgi:hypothetical protein